MLFGVAEDHDSNPLKMGISKLKQRGARFVSVNPVRTGYSAIADNWIGIRPGTDGLFILSLIHCLLKARRIDVDYLLRYTRDFPLAVVEAKASYKSATDAVQQARDYAEILGLKYAYATNGAEIIEIDYFKGAETRVADFPQRPRR